MRREPTPAITALLQSAPDAGIRLQHTNYDYGNERFSLIISGYAVGQSVACPADVFTPMEFRLSCLVADAYEQGRKDGAMLVQDTLRALCGVE